MEALDGNAIAGPLFEYFGHEMTTAKGTCGHCGASAMIAELQVFSQAPGTVAHCPRCGNVVMVLVKIRDNLKVHLLGFRLADATGDT
jgi:ribosomal protein S27AE